ncbi:MAG: sn-glycerol-3-phosphate ABC transporter ATP-binding protein UgpC [Pseudomonadota bacterium]
MARIEFDRVGKRFGDVEVIDDQSLTIESGELLVLLGPSGCGKSTLLRMIAGLESPTSGEIRIDGRVVNHVRPKDRDIAMVFQNYALYPDKTVYDNLAFALRRRGTGRSEIDKRVHEVAEALEIDAFLKRKPAELSGGQRQRVASGRAVIRLPKAFLFDEPLINLDAKLRVQTRTEIARLHRQFEGTTIYVTHDQAEAMTLADRIVVLNAGEIMQVGRPTEIYGAPENLFVAGFVGSPEMNYFDVRLEGRDGHPHMVHPQFAAPIDAALERRLSAAPGGRVTLGARPESLRLNGAATFDADSVALSAAFDVVEELGPVTYLQGRAGDVHVTAAVESGAQPALATATPLSVRFADLHFFASESGLRL